MVRLYALHILLVSEGLCPSCAARTASSSTCRLAITEPV